MSSEAVGGLGIWLVQSRVRLGTGPEEFGCLALTPMMQDAETTDEMMLAGALRSIQGVTEGFGCEKRRHSRRKKVSLE